MEEGMRVRGRGMHFHSLLRRSGGAWMGRKKERKIALHVVGYLESIIGPFGV